MMMMMLMMEVAIAGDALVGFVISSEQHRAGHSHQTPVVMVLIMMAPTPAPAPASTPTGTASLLLPRCPSVICVIIATKRLSQVGWPRQWHLVGTDV